jgi:hypothetical protein
MDVPNDAIKPVEVLPRGDEHDDWRWLTRQLLERAHWELERADEKANTLFRLYGVVLAAGVAFSVTGNSRSLSVAAGSILLVAAIFGLTAGGMLAMALAPRHRRSLKTALGRAPGYFGDVNAYLTPHRSPGRWRRPRGTSTSGSSIRFASSARSSIVAIGSCVPRQRSPGPASY